MAVSQPKEIVARGYDAIALRYAEWAGQIDSPALEWVRDLDARLGDGCDVLELGCGRGVPATRELARRHRVTGVDISGVQIELARHHVPEATFLHEDVTALDIAAASFDAVVALFLFGHLPQEEQPELMARVASWLRPGGLFLGTLGGGDSHEEVEEDWLGAPMFFASLGADEYRRLLPRLGFELVRAEIEPQVEHGREVRFFWVLARGPG